VDLAERVIAEQGGQRLLANGRIVHQIDAQPPACLQRIESAETQTAALREKLRSEIVRTVTQPPSKQELARAAYCAICLDLAGSLQQEHPQPWSEALAALNSYQNVVQAIFHHAPTPLGDALRKKTLAAGLQKPATRADLW
jgi:hypothetical protein